jgi:dihydropteroate synthase
MRIQSAQCPGSSVQGTETEASSRSSGHWALGTGHSFRWSLRGREIALDRPVVMGILNLTPDSFSDGGRFVAFDDAVRRARQMAAEGADLLDLGGESTRPGAPEVSADEEAARVVPVLRALRDSVDLPLSVDTRKAAVAAEALAAGAHVVNDVAAELAGPLARAGAAGIARGRIVLDPGIGFAKTAEQNLELIASLRRLEARLGRPVLLGPSRKSFIGALLGGIPPEARDAGTVGACVAGLARGARLFRVHDVRGARQALDVAWAVLRIPERAP